MHFVKYRYLIQGKLIKTTKASRIDMCARVQGNIFYIWMYILPQKHEHVPPLVQVSLKGR